MSKSGAINKYPPVADRIDQLLDSTGDGTGTTEQATTADEYMYKPGAGVVAILERVLIGIEDNAKFAAEKYAGIAALANGITFTIKDSNDDVIHTFNPQPIKKTWHYGLLAGSDELPSEYTTGNDRTLIRWTLTKGGYPVILNGDEGEYLSCNIPDSLATLVSQIMQVQGYKATQ
jgi:hypothetical protein